MKIITHKDEYWIRFGEPKQSSSFTGDLGGKYLFFSGDQGKLIQIAKFEIMYHDFEVAKVSITASNREYVLCLYWRSNERKFELADRYKKATNIKYRYWKSNANTRAGIYSEQH